jgi:hypothetical protein
VGLAFQHQREVTIAGVPEPDPIATPPLPSAIFRLGSRPPSGNLLTVGMELYGEFAGGVPGPAASYDFVIWMRDEGPAASWTPIPIRKKHPNRMMFPTDEVRNADVFVQVLAVQDPGAATTILLHATEL